MPRKPDRFERMVRKRFDAIQPENIELQFRDSIFASISLDLLRKEHAWMRRMVKRSAKWYEDYFRLAPPEPFVADILDQLTQRRK